MKYWQSIGLSALAWSALEAQITPSLLVQSRNTLKVTEPYKWSVLVRVQGGRASGVAVAPKAYATAGHVVFDGDAWVTAGSIQAYWCNHSTATPTFERELGRGVHRWASYATRVANDGTEEGTSSIDTFNMDFAVVYTANAIADDESFAPIMVDPEDTGQVSFMRRTTEKTIVGYPADSDFIAVGDIGKMHQNAPGNYKTFWWGGSEFPFDSEGLWTGTHYFSDVVTYGGNSGGPVYGKGRDGQWYLNALLVGGATSDSTIRGIDEAAWDMIDAAIDASGGAPVRRVETFSAIALEDGRVELNWTDRSNGETAYIVERRETNGYTTVATLPANTQGWTDATVPSGSVAAYRITPSKGTHESAPPSDRLVVETPGNQPGFGTILGEPRLFFRTTGDAPMGVDGASIASGKIWGMETSDLELDLIGPGQVTFSWSVSSELNPDFFTPGSPYEGDIYDALFCFQNGVQKYFISGLGVAETRTLDLGSGAQKVVWSYAKDPYSDDGEDRGRIQSVTWTPDATNPHPYGAYALDAQTALATWFGPYSIDHFPWAFHPELGWLYFSAFDGVCTWAYSPDAQLGWLYLKPDAYPYVYSPKAGGWLYYVPLTGSGGVGGWLYDFKARRWLRMG